MDQKPSWTLFRGNGRPHDVKFPEPPPWRTFQGVPIERTLRPAVQRPRFLIEDPEIALVNAALYLRRPLLVTGRAGIGKSSLVHAVAHELKLGEVLVWPVNTRSTLQDALYRYDAIGRFQAKQLGEEHDIGGYITLGPLGTALLPSDRPRVLLIDEIDKSDIDLPNDLLNVFETASFEIPELSRLPKGQDVVYVETADKSSESALAEEGAGNAAASVEDRVPIRRGRVTSKEFPFVIMTSNGERDFPAPFLRRCIRLQMDPPSDAKLAQIVAAHLGKAASERAADLIKDFSRRSASEELATDQLLNAVYLVTKQRIDIGNSVADPLYGSILKSLR